MAHLPELFRNGSLSDVEVVLECALGQKRCLQLHSVVLSQSPVLRQMLTLPMRERDTRRVQLKETCSLATAVGFLVSAAESLRCLNSFRGRCTPDDSTTPGRKKCCW